MKAFKLHHLYQDTLSTQVMACFSMSQTDEERFTEKTYDNMNVAKAHIYSTKKDWLLFCIEKFVLHKKRIWEATNNATALNNVRICQDTYNTFGVDSLEKICKRMIKGQAYFEAILPSPNNSSYESSKANLTEILTFCNNEAQLKH